MILDKHSNENGLTASPCIPNHHQQLSLRSLLLGILLLAASFALLKSASHHRSFSLALLAISCLGIGLGMVTRRYLQSATIVVLLAVISACTTTYNWQGGYPLCQLRLQLIDQEGAPIEGAEMHVFSNNSGKRAISASEDEFAYPIAEYGHYDLVSDDEGVIVCHQIRELTQFGGTACTLFWCIPMGTRVPEYYVRFEHPQYKYSQVPIEKVFASNFDSYGEYPRTVIRIGDQTAEMRIYKQQFTLTEKQSKI